jgi:hypothetical protein
MRVSNRHEESFNPALLLSRGSDTRGITDPVPLRVLLPHASCTLGVREVLARCGSPSPIAPIEHQRVPQNAVDRPMARGGVERPKAGAGE